MSKQVNTPAGWATVLLWVLMSALGGGIGFALGFAVCGREEAPDSCAGY